MIDCSAGRFSASRFGNDAELASEMELHGKKNFEF